MWIYGINPVESVLKKRLSEVKELIVVKSKKENEKINSFINLAKKNNIKFKTLNLEEAINLTGLKENINHQRVFLNVNDLKTYSVDEVIKEEIKSVLILDSITDVNNFGAIIRSGVAFDIDLIVIAKDRSSKITSDLYKTSSGAVENIKICIETNLSRTVEILKENGFWVYGFEEYGSESIYEIDLKGKVCLVIGGEDTGIRRLLKEKCDFLLKIPIENSAHSLNASVAAAISMYELKRQNK
jgi:23S rRNA (guanosine2251-2'-O)-methyltransferase